MRLLFIALMISLINQALALDAVVTVLESPMLKEPNLEAPVVQYLRKGDVIKINPTYTPDPDGEAEFVPTQDRQGNVVYVISDHLYFYYETKRESTQKTLKKDPTDYRLEEPLPENYPIGSPQGYKPTAGYRALFSLGVTQPYNSSYPYEASATRKSSMIPIVMNVVLMKRAPRDKDDRLYIGGGLDLRYFKNSFSLTDQKTSDETIMRIGIGPYVSYDAYKGRDERISLFAALPLNLLNTSTISQTDGLGVSETRRYRGYNIAPKVGFHFTWMDVGMKNFNLLIGTSMEIEPSTSYSTDTQATQANWWQGESDDKFRTATTFNLAGFLGIQYSY